MRDLSQETLYLRALFEEELALLPGVSQEGSFQRIEPALAHPVIYLPTSDTYLHRKRGWILRPPSSACIGMKGSPRFRNRLLVALLLTALAPASILLVAGSWVLKEVVVSTGSAGAWDEVGRSGRELLAEVEVIDDPSPALVSAASDHRENLTESLRLSRLYGFLGERALSLLPGAVFLLLIVAGAASLLAANRISRSFSQPLEEIVRWTRAIGASQPLPPADPSSARREIGEFSLLKEELRKASSELERGRQREAERIRMQGWSEMARRVAHDLRNPLTPMQMAADRVARSPDPKIAEAGEILQEEIRRLDDMARAFSHFGRPAEGPMSPIDLGELLTSLSRRLSSEGAPIKVALPTEQIEVEGHLDALERVVRNLIANAQEATAAVGGEEGAAQPIEIVLQGSSDTSLLRVLDRGTGIPPELQNRIWLPDFTTKRTGTGLGLAMARQVIEAHGGEIEALSRAGGGTEFRVTLPRIVPSQSPEKEVSQA